MVTIGKGKHFSLGLDLEGLITLSAPEIMEFTDGLQKLLGRILTFPLVTVAAINGIQIRAGGPNIWTRGNKKKGGGSKFVVTGLIITRFA